MIRDDELLCRPIGRGAKVADLPATSKDPFAVNPFHACRTCVRFYFKHSYLPHKTGWYLFDGTLFTMTCSIPVSGTHIINDYMVEETIGISRPLLNHRFCAILSDHNVSLKVQNDSEIGGEIGGDLVLRIWCECKKRFLLLLSDFFTKKDILSFIHSLSLYPSITMPSECCAQKID